MRHKHADLIHAWAEGAEIDMRSDSTYPRWMPVTMAYPAFDPEKEYRIRPKPTRDDIGFVGIYIEPDGTWHVSYAYEESRNVPGHKASTQLAGIIKVTQSGETGKLIKAEVL